MAIVASKPEQKDFEIPGDGLYQAVLADVVDLGDQPTMYGVKPRVRLVFVLAETDSEGRPFRLMQHMTKSLHEKAALYKAVRRLLGKEPPDSLDLETLIGKQCQLDVVQNEGSEGKMYANIANVLSPVKGQAVGIPQDFVRNCDKDNDQKKAVATPKTQQKTQQKTQPKVTNGGATAKPKPVSAGVEVGPQEGSEGNVGITDEDIPF